MIVAFGLLGLLGGYATFAVQIPFGRLAARDHTLDKVLAASSPADLEKLRPLLGDSADHVLADPMPPGPGVLAARVAAERRRTLAELYADSVDYGFRLRIVIAVFTAAACLFGCMVLGVVRGRPG
jgi:hypothetical protein